jgi:hypothetical protein
VDRAEIVAALAADRHAPAHARGQAQARFFVEQVIGEDA